VTTTHTHDTVVSDHDRRRFGRRAQLLARASVTYNVVEAVIAITAGIVASSIALVGFGLDSIVEVSSGLIILWQFRHPLPESREKAALRLMAFSFFGLAAYVTFESVRSILTGHEPDSSTVGIILAATSLVVMPFLSWAQRRTGRALGSNAVVADSTQTLLCTYLSAVLLLGLALNATLGWYWADPIAGLVIAAVAIKEGREAWRGEGCCGPIGRHDDSHGGTAYGCADGAGDCADGCCVAADEHARSTENETPAPATLLDLAPTDSRPLMEP
jgi:divalent metal cation (Fe/Co/Zn/Cd) transporter